MLAQDRPDARVWLRGSRGFPRKPKAVKGLDAVIEIASLGIVPSLTEIYAGFE